MVSVSDEARVTTVRLSTEAREAVNELCATFGVTLTGLLEAFGQHLAEEMPTPEDVDRESHLWEWITHARLIDAERRSRA